MSQLPSIKYTYLDKRVKGEAVRLALVIGGIPFKDERVSYEEVSQRRAAGQLPFGQVPVIEIDGKTYAQSGALLRWAGKQGGLYPDEHMLLIDNVVETINDLWPECIKIGYGSAMMRHPVTGRPMVSLTMAQQREQRSLCHDVLFPTRFQQLEKLEQASFEPFFCGSQVTLADVALYAMASQILQGHWAGNGITPDVLDACPKLKRLVDSVHELLAVQRWYAQIE